LLKNSKKISVKQVVERGYSVPDVSKPIGESVQSLYKWIKVYSPGATERYESELKQIKKEKLQLKVELRRAQEERDILKKRPRTSPETQTEVRVSSGE
jgi:transposase